MQAEEALLPEEQQEAREVAEPPSVYSAAQYEALMDQPDPAVMNQPDPAVVAAAEAGAIAAANVAAANATVTEGGWTPAAAAAAAAKESEDTDKEKAKARRRPSTPPACGPPSVGRASLSARVD